MRIVSLWPAATEWLFAFGAGAALVGRSHACDAPEAARALPPLTRTDVDPSASAGTLDAAVRARIAAGDGLYVLDAPALRALAPDLVVTQAACAACAVTPDAVRRTWPEGEAPPVVAHAPMTFKAMLDAALAIGRAAGCLEGAMRTLAAGEARLRRLHAALGIDLRGDDAGRPRVACVEWTDPLMTAGHWMPDVVRLAGGRSVLAEGGVPSRYMDPARLWDEDPDVLCVMPCGRTEAQARADLAALAARPGWADLRAVRAGRVHVFDGDALFNRPGPRLYDSVERLARALHGA